MAINAMELAEYLQSQAQGCKDLSNALEDARRRMAPLSIFDDDECSPCTDLLVRQTSRAIDFLNELETALDSMSDELYREGWE